eukprot:16439490-Heterocapsa_arctica.AAC.1
MPCASCCCKAGWASPSSSPAPCWRRRPLGPAAPADMQTPGRSSSGPRRPLPPPGTETNRTLSGQGGKMR